MVFNFFKIQFFLFWEGGNANFVFYYYHHFALIQVHLDSFLVRKGT